MSLSDLLHHIPNLLHCIPHQNYSEPNRVFRIPSHVVAFETDIKIASEMPIPHGLGK